MVLYDSLNISSLHKVVLEHLGLPFNAIFAVFWDMHTLMLHIVILINLQFSVQA